MGISFPRHDSGCKFPNGMPCRRFSTDGTLLGAYIAHTMNTTDEKEIARRGRLQPEFESDVDEEQADWESNDVGD